MVSCTHFRKTCSLRGTGRRIRGASSDSGVPHLYTPLNISEQAIEKFGTKRIATWAYLRLRNPNGVVFGGYDQQRAGKTGWTRSTFFSRMAGLVESGLARKDKWGNWMLAPVAELSKNHSCTLLLSPEMDEYAVRDVVLLKLFERGHRQIVRSIKKSALSDREQLMDKAWRERCGKTKITTSVYGDIGLDSLDFVKLSTEEARAPMNSDTLMRMTGLSRWTLFAWKKRAKARGWIDQQNTQTQIPTHYNSGMDYLTEEVEATRKGRVSYCSTAGVYLFNQAACYKLLLSYSTKQSK